MLGKICAFFDFQVVGVLLNIYFIFSEIWTHIYVMFATVTRPPPRFLRYKALLCGWSTAQSASEGIFASFLVNSFVLTKSGQSADLDYNWTEIILREMRSFCMMMARDAERLLLWSADTNRAWIILSSK